MIDHTKGKIVNGECQPSSICESCEIIEWGKRSIKSKVYLCPWRLPGVITYILTDEYYRLHKLYMKDGQIEVVSNRQLWKLLEHKGFECIQEKEYICGGLKANDHLKGALSLTEQPGALSIAEDKRGELSLSEKGNKWCSEILYPICEVVIKIINYFTPER
jgi:hypothetical protein